MTSVVTVVIGTQFGDEGKGKIIDYLARDADFVVRFHGGAGAGHTVVNNFGTFKMHLIPCGIFNKNVKCVIANGVMVDPEILLQEIDSLKRAGIRTKGRLFVSSRAHVVLPYHKILDGIFDEAKGKLKTATTGRGNGPVHADKTSYYGILVQDLLDKKLFGAKLEKILNVKNKIIKEFGGKELSLPKILRDYSIFFSKLRPFIANTFEILNGASEKKKTILFEGAHGLYLDNDWGTYPYVTASSTLPANIGAGAGVSPSKIDSVVGIVKAYTTRIDSGAGPLPTEFFGKLADAIRGWGGEFGATTGRPRRIGWLDLIQLKLAVKLAGINYLTLTKVDVLSSLRTVPVCTNYKLGGRTVDYLDLNAEQLKKVVPIYKDLPGWAEIGDVRKYNDLPKELKNYVEMIEKFVGVPVKILSIGPERNQTIIRG